MTIQTTTTETLTMPTLDVMQLCDAVEHFTTVGTQAIGTAGYLNALSFDDHHGALVARCKWSGEPDQGALEELVGRLARGEIKPLKPRHLTHQRRQRVTASKPTSACECSAQSCACESRSLASTASDGDVCQWVTLPIVTTEIERAQVLDNFASLSAYASECVGACSTTCDDVLPIVITKGGPSVGWVRAMRENQGELQASVTWVGVPRALAGVHAIDRIHPETGANTGLAIFEVLAVAGAMLRRRPLPQHHQAQQRKQEPNMSHTITPAMPTTKITNTREAAGHLSQVLPIWNQMDWMQRDQAAVALRNLCRSDDLRVSLARITSGRTILACCYPGQQPGERLRAYLASLDPNFTKLSNEDQQAKVTELRASANVVDE